MLAVGTSGEDAEEITSLPSFPGRLAIAAHNSSASIILSGDADAIVHAKKVFEEEKEFARLLKVDTAYHSHHIATCGDPYVASLRECGIRINNKRSSTAPVWFSSVVPSDKGMEPIDDLKDVYWRDNMTNSVLFAEPVKNAVADDDQIGLALEIGPHPGLKGPASQTISDVRSSTLPYSGVLSRESNDVDAFSDALGFLWTQLGSQGPDFQSYAKAVNPQSQKPRLVVDLSIPRAITFEERRQFRRGNSCHTDRSPLPNKTATASFSCYSLPIVGTGSEQEMELMASATVNVVFSSPSVTARLCAPLEDRVWTRLSARASSYITRRAVQRAKPTHLQHCIH